METENGQITVAAGLVCLRFKNISDCIGHYVFVKCTFTGRGASIFLPGIPIGDAAEPGLSDDILAPPQMVESEPVEILNRSGMEGDDSPDVDGSPASDADEGATAHDEAPVIDASISIDIDFSLGSTKFDLTEPNLSKLETTEAQLELILLDESGTKTVIGATSVPIANILRGVNEWTDEFSLGTHDGLEFNDAGPAETTLLDPEAEVGVEGLVAKEQRRAIEDTSAGPLKFAGSTSTLRVTLMSDDDTADYTVGAGSLWIDGAEVTGVPESWKIQPPPGTGRKSRNSAIAEILAGQPRHEYSIWWGANEKLSEDGNTEAGGGGGGGGVLFPSMRIGRGVLSYEPDDEKENDSSVNEDFNDNASVATGPASSNRGGSTEGGISAAALVPPKGPWSVRFSSSRRQSVFLTRGSIYALRRTLLSGIGNIDGHDVKFGEGQNNEANVSGAILPLFLERRQLHLKPNADVGKSGKGAKKGKKIKKRAAAEQSEMKPETLWLCRANVDVSPLVIASNYERDGGGGCDNERRENPAGVGSVRTSDSPLRVELRATLALETLVNETVTANSTGMEVSGSTPGAAEGNTLADDMGNSEKTAATNEAETRALQMKTSGTTLLLTFALTRPLAKAPTRQETVVSVRDVFMPKDVGPWKPPRDVDAELKEELDGFVLTVLGEYVKLFLESGADSFAGKEVSVDEREKQLFYALNSGGIYHSFLERLKPRVQRVVRKRFGTVPTDAAEFDTFVADLYAHLVEQAGIVLNQRIRNVEAKAIPSYVTLDADKTLEQKVEHLGILADDAESRASHAEAAARHEDRIEAATAAAKCREDWRILLAYAWEGYARFCLRRQGREPQNKYTEKAHLDQSARCFEEALRIYLPGSEESLVATIVLAAVMLEKGQVDMASALLENARAKRLPEPEDGADGYETDILASLIPRRDHALACLLRDRMGDASGARRSLFLAVLSSKREAERGEKGSITSDDEPGTPRRTTVRVMHDACSWLLELGLPLTARQAFVVSRESERVAVKKAQGRGLPTRTPTSLRESFRRLESFLLVAEWKLNDSETELMVGQDVKSGQNSSDADGISSVIKAEILAQEAVELLPDDPRPWQALAEAYEAQGAAKASEAADGWINALDRLEATWRSGMGPIPSLWVYMRPGTLYNILGRADEAKACFLRACRAWRAPGPWLQCGVACLRLEQWEEAEDALQHASRLDCNSPLVWGNLALLLLSQGEERIEEADRALSQALRLGLSDASLLREVGNCYVAIDRLEAAENVLRMSLAADINDKERKADEPPLTSSSGGRRLGNPHTRKRLADVLSARNATNQAVDEYRSVLESPSVDELERQEDVLVRCGNLLRKIGRGNEIDKLLLPEVCPSNEGGHVQSHWEEGLKRPDDS